MIQVSSYNYLGGYMAFYDDVKFVMILLRTI